MLVFMAMYPPKFLSQDDLLILMRRPNSTQRVNALAGEDNDSVAVDLRAPTAGLGRLWKLCAPRGKEETSCQHFAIASPGQQ